MKRFVAGIPGLLASVGVTLIIGHICAKNGVHEAWPGVGIMPVTLMLIVFACGIDRIFQRLLNR